MNLFLDIKLPVLIISGGFFSIIIAFIQLIRKKKDQRFGLVFFHISSMDVVLFVTPPIVQEQNI